MALLDEAIIAEVRDTLGDEAYLGFVGRMLDEAEVSLAELGGLLAQGNLPKLAQLAHRTAGSAVSVGASGLHGRLKEIEDCVHAGQADRLPALVASLTGVVSDTRVALEILMARPA